MGRRIVIPTSVPGLTTKQVRAVDRTLMLFSQPVCIGSARCLVKSAI